MERLDMNPESKRFEPTSPGYGTAIYWLETAPRKIRPSLQSSIKCDYAIVGGGFLGLWSAYELKQLQPSADVVVLEAEDVAHGASGRNGGFAMTLLDMSLHHLVQNHGEEAAKKAHDAVAEAVHEIGQITDSEGIDCDYHLGGLLVVATNPAQEARLEKDLEAARRLGLQTVKPLSAEEVRKEVNSPTYRAALFEEDCAVLHPAKLARGLADVLERKGVAIYEDSPVLDLRAEAGTLRLVTPKGSVEAPKVLVCTNAWAYRLAPFRRKIVPLYTYVILTEPLTAKHMESIGWGRRQGIEDKRNYVHYYRLTADNRILWGGSDGMVYKDLGIRPSYDRCEPIFQKLEQTFRRTFPQLEDVRFTHRWGGPVAMTPTFVPIYGSLEQGTIHYGLGCNGHGVAPARLGGKILADLATDNDRGTRDLFFVHGKELEFPPQPLCWIGAEATRRALLAQDAAMDSGREAGDMDPWLLKVLRKLG
jgi:glycine/D-amino acid oxidase-like deaminating enzyme